MNLHSFTHHGRFREHGGVSGIILRCRRVCINPHEAHRCDHGLISTGSQLPHETWRFSSSEHCGRVRFYCARHSNHTLLGLQNAIPTRSALSATAESISLDLVQKWFRKGREVPGAAQRSLPVITQTQIWLQTLHLPSSLA